MAAASTEQQRDETELTVLSAHAGVKAKQACMLIAHKLISGANTWT